MIFFTKVASWWNASFHQKTFYGTRRAAERTQKKYWGRIVSSLICSWITPVPWGCPWYCESVLQYFGVRARLSVFCVQQCPRVIDCCFVGPRLGRVTPPCRFFFTELQSHHFSRRYLIFCEKKLYLQEISNITVQNPIVNIMVSYSNG